MSHEEGNSTQKPPQSQLDLFVRCTSNSVRSTSIHKAQDPHSALHSSHNSPVINTTFCFLFSVLCSLLHTHTLKSHSTLNSLSLLPREKGIHSHSPHSHEKRYEIRDTNFVDINNESVSSSKFHSHSHHGSATAAPPTSEPTSAEPTSATATT
jgi:hypothetical protein